MAVDQYRSKLAVALNAADQTTTEVYVDEITTLTDESFTFSNFAPFTRGALIVDPGAERGSDTVPEIIIFTGVDSTNKKFTGCTRGWSTVTNGQITDNITYHGVDAPVVIAWGATNIKDILDYVATLVSGSIGTASDTIAGSSKITEDMGSSPRSMAALVSQQASPNLTVLIHPFSVAVLGTTITYAGGNSPSISAPSSNPRIDLLVYDTVNSVIAVRAGTEASSPSAPTPSNGDYVLCAIYNRVGETTILERSDGTNGYIQRWYQPNLFAAVPPTGSKFSYTGRTAPNGYGFTDGGTLSRTGEANLFNVMMPSKTATITIASPGVITASSHGYRVGDQVSFTTTGSLPTGLATGVVYYVISAGLDTNNFEVSTSFNGSAVNTSGTQSGTHTVYLSNYGIGDGSTTYNVPLEFDYASTAVSILSAEQGTSNNSKYLKVNSNLGITSNTSGFSMTAYVKLNTEISSNVYTFLFVSDSTSKISKYINYQYNSGTRRVVFWWRDVSETQIFYNLTMGTSAWYRFDMTYSGSVLKAYVNGVLVGTSAANPTSSSTTIDYTSIGAEVNSGGSGISNTFASAKIALVQIYNKEVSATDISNYNSNPIAFAAGTPNLRAQYLFNPITTDSSGNSYTLTNSGSTTTSTDVPGSVQSQQSGFYYRIIKK